MKKNNIMYDDNKQLYISYYVAIFLMYGLIGYVLEMFYRNVIVNEQIKIGFLSFTPILPIYGVMGVILTMSLPKIGTLINKVNTKTSKVLATVLVYFLFFMLSALVLEFVGGYLLEYIFKERKWNYSNQPLNYKGYFSIPYLFVFSFIGILHMYTLFYILDSLIVLYIKYNFIRLVLLLISILVIGDFAYTIAKI